MANAQAVASIFSFVMVIPSLPIPRAGKRGASGA